MSKTTYILDASALLALMLGEEGSEAVHAVLPHATMSAVNLSEVIAKLQERGVPEAVTAMSLTELDLTITPFDGDQAKFAGKLRSATKAKGLSLGDRACLAAALATGPTAITTDRAWSDLDMSVTIVVAR